jgi:DDE_Tnp_1-associated
MQEPNYSQPIYSLLDILGDIEDPRIDRKKLYPLEEILFLMVCAVMSGLQE